MTTLDASDVFQKNPEIAHRVVDGTAVLVNPREATMLTLNEVGTLFWSLRGELSLAEIAERVTEEFEVERDEALDHILQFVGELDERALVRRAAPSRE
jgi:hypothetical protein